MGKNLNAESTQNELECKCAAKDPGYLDVNFLPADSCQTVYKKDKMSRNGSLNSENSYSQRQQNLLDRSEI